MKKLLAGLKKVVGRLRRPPPGGDDRRRTDRQEGDPLSTVTVTGPDGKLIHRGKLVPQADRPKLE